MAKPVGTGTFSNLGHTQALRGRQCDQAKVRELPSWPGAQKMTPHKEAEYMTATGSRSSDSRNSLARGSGPYMCVSPENEERS
jgi:hypothetical protein